MKVMMAPEITRPAAADRRIDAAKPTAAPASAKDAAADFHAELRRAAKPRKEAEDVERPDPETVKPKTQERGEKSAVAKQSESRQIDPPSRDTPELEEQMGIGESEELGIETVNEVPVIDNSMGEIMTATAAASTLGENVPAAALTASSTRPVPAAQPGSTATPSAPALTAEQPVSPATPIVSMEPAGQNAQEGQQSPEQQASSQATAKVQAVTASPTNPEARELPSLQPITRPEAETVVKPQAAPATLPSRPTAGEDGAPDVNAARVARGLQNAVQQNGGTVTLRLTPAELGTVRIQMHLQGTSVSAQFFTETDKAQAALHHQLSQLRGALESQGLTVDRLQVQTMQQGGSSQASGGHQQQPSDGSSQDGRSRGFLGGDQGRQASSGGEQRMTRDERRRSVFSNFLAEERA